MARYSEELVEEIKNNNDIVDVISQYVILKRSGRNFFGLCPFHKEKSPSFSVSTDKQIFHCFGCGVGGNVIHFISKIENISYRESLELLANRANITLPILNDNYQDNKKMMLKSKVLEINEITAKFYHENLYKPTSKQAQEYIKKRKLDNRTLKSFLIGYSGNFDELYKLLRQKGYTEEEILASSLVNKADNGRYIDRFRKRLMIPIQDATGKFIAFGGRVLDDSKPKYINSPENVVYSKGRNLFGLNIAKKGDTKKIIVVEGYMDAISSGTALTWGILGPSISQLIAFVLVVFLSNFLVEKFPIKKEHRYLRRSILGTIASAIDLLILIMLGGIGVLSFVDMLIIFAMSLVLVSGTSFAVCYLRKFLNREPATKMDDAKTNESSSEESENKEDVKSDEQEIVEEEIENEDKEN